MTDLVRIPIEKRPATVRVEGRVLYLVDDAPLLRAQLFEGRDLTLEEARAAGLRDQISTDEITPAYICYFFDETLGEFPYPGLRAANPGDGEAGAGANEAPVTRSARINAGPGITRGADEVSVSSQNRNFPGRSGPGQLYLVSPYSVAASAIVGYVAKWEPGQPFEPVRSKKLATV